MKTQLACVCSSLWVVFHHREAPMRSNEVCSALGVLTLTSPSQDSVQLTPLDHTQLHRPAPWDLGANPPRPEAPERLHRGSPERRLEQNTPSSWPGFILKVVFFLDLQALLLRELDPMTAVLHHRGLQALVLQVSQGVAIEIIKGVVA